MVLEVDTSKMADSGDEKENIATEIIIVRAMESLAMNYSPLPCLGCASTKMGRGRNTNDGRGEEGKAGINEEGETEIKEEGEKGINEEG
ncbi:hypothetical protein Pcinc_038420 [Petrolisthes cinctipes]|uniref:Uncharacterized protein n=1 Tax=Petrolisthes cinctipes TaxID=88211 RepID=A0AAE1BQP7_PETCI|nr:hypothetical protein Pcinc_038420 [Petrolisthes cinctipes]